MRITKNIFSVREIFLFYLCVIQIQGGKLRKKSAMQKVQVYFKLKKILNIYNFIEYYRQRYLIERRGMYVQEWGSYVQCVNDLTVNGFKTQFLPSRLITFKSKTIIKNRLCIFIYFFMYIIYVHIYWFKIKLIQNT